MKLCTALISSFFFLVSPVGATSAPETGKKVIKTDDKGGFVSMAWDRPSKKCEIRISGEIKEETASALRELVLSPANKHCYEPRVSLNSRGGSVDVGIRIGRLIRSFELDTIIKKGDSCASACGLVYIGGVKRIADISKETPMRFGLHQSWWRDETRTGQICITADKIDHNDDEIAHIKKMLKKDAATFYLHQISTVSCKTMKWFSAIDILEAGIATHYRERQ